MTTSSNKKERAKMAITNIDLPRDTTMRDIAASLRAIAGFAVSDIVDIKQIKAIVEGKKEKEVFNIGDQITIPWTDKATNTTYAAAMDIVHFGDVELKSGDTTNAMFLQWHYATPFGVQYDAPEVEVASEATFSTDYNYYLKDSNGNFSVADVTIGGTIPAGTTYYHNEIKDTSGSICKFGYNRWSHSAMRQWLNSDKGVNAWWNAQHKGDVKPAELATKAGFLTGFDDDFLNCLTPIKIVTLPNIISEPDKNVSNDITYDKFFLPSLEQMYCKPQATGEGEYWEYWKKASGSTTPCQQRQTYPEMATHAIENHSAAQNVRLRSDSRNNTSNTWSVYSGGSFDAGYASTSMRCTPACAITGISI